MAIKKVRIRPEGENNYADIVHPETSADVVIESTTKRFVSDTDKANWNAKWDYNENTIKNVKVNNAVNADTVNGKTVESNVPSNAKFTDTTYSEISTSEIDAGTSSTLRTISGRRIKYILDKVQGWINALTKADVGLGNVLNYGVATQAEAQAGTSNAKYMTPIRTKEAIQALQAVSSVNSKTGAVTLSKSDVGLGNVDNVKQATKVEFDEHKADGASHSKTARFVIGTSTAGWTTNDCDYLCDGTADDVEINQAITALPATGGEIVILDGTYNITAKINVTKDNVSIVGNGKSTCLSKKWNADDGTITVTSKYCSIRNIYFYGNDSQPFATNAGIYLSVGADSSVINNNWFENFECGIHVFSSHNSISSNVCHVLPTDGYGIILKSSDNAIINNVCNGGNYGIYLDSSNNNTITGNTCNDNNSYGIYLYSSSSDNTVTGNTCNNNSNSGIYLSSSSSDNTVTGNTCNNNNYGIRLSSSSNNTVTGNTCNDNIYGIYFQTSNNNTVTGNTCIRGTGLATDYTESQYTIRLYGTGNNYNLISNNNCMGKAVTNGGGTGNTLVNNKFDAS